MKGRVAEIAIPDFGKWGEHAVESHRRSSPLQALYLDARTERRSLSWLWEAIGVIPPPAGNVSQIGKKFVRLVCFKNVPIQPQREMLLSFSVACLSGFLNKR